MARGAAERSLGQHIIFLKGLQVKKKKRGEKKGLTKINYIYMHIYHIPNLLQVLGFKVRGFQAVSL